MRRFLVLYATGLVTFLVVDLAWIRLVVGPIFRSELGNLLAESFRPGPALVFYALFVLGVLYLVVLPSSSAGWSSLLGRAALFGACCYGTYELTNYATLAGWPLHVVVLDVAWGIGIACLVASVVRLIGRSCSLLP